MSAPRSNEWAVLAGLRFALASIVLASHLSICTNADIGNTHALGPFAAVIGFFLVSGYSIAASLERDDSTRYFYQRRMVRIFPIYIACQVLSLALAALVSPEIGAYKGGGYFIFPSPMAFAGNLLLLQGFLCATSPFLAPGWSLSLECGYYLFAPVLIRLTGRALISIVIASAALYVIHHHFRGQATASETAGMGWVVLAWAWALGFALRRYAASPLVQSLALVVPPALILIDNPYGGLYAPITVLASAVALTQARSLLVAPAVARVLTYLGELSYPLYLCHWIVLLLFAHIASQHPAWVSMPAVIACALGLAAVLYHLVDVPIRLNSNRKSRLGSFASAHAPSALAPAKK